MPDLYLPPLCTIHPWSPEALGPQLNSWNLGVFAVASRIWGTANRAMFVPFKLFVPATIRQFFVYNGATVTGNVDVGIYSADRVRLCSAGSTPQSGINAIQALDITDVQIGPGVFWLALAFSSGSATITSRGDSATTYGFMGGGGGLAQNNAFPLPSTMGTLVLYPNNTMPMFGLSTRSLI